MLKEICLEITSACPNACVHCSSDAGGRSARHICFGLFQKMISEAAALGVRTICLSGGEPFCHPDLVRMAQFVSDTGMDCAIYTSGSMFAGSGSPVPLDPKLLQSLAAAGVRLIFSVLGAEEETCAHLSGREEYLPRLTASAAAAADSGIPIEAHVPLMRPNMGEVPVLLSLCERLGMQRVSFLRLVCHGRAKEHWKTLCPDEDELAAIRAKLMGLQNPNPVIRLGTPMQPSKTVCPCGAGRRKLCIDSDGLVFPCEAFKAGAMRHMMHGTEPDSVADSPLRNIYMHSPYLIRARQLQRLLGAQATHEPCMGQYFTQGCPKRENPSGASIPERLF